MQLKAMVKASHFAGSVWSSLGFAGTLAEPFFGRKRMHIFMDDQKHLKGFFFKKTERNS